jgi:E3 ubiquitin-protein ligase RGLG
MEMIGLTLAPFDNDNLIPVYGFGTKDTENHSVFSFKSDGKNDLPCKGIEEAIRRYREIAYYLTSNKQLSGPTSFVPIIRKAVQEVKETGTYHILLIIADGTMDDYKETCEAILEASNYPLSIVIIGVGDGETWNKSGNRWETMKKLDDDLHKFKDEDGNSIQKFDNVQFVDYNKVMLEGKNNPNYFALHALMEIPIQYKRIKELGLLRSRPSRISVASAPALPVHAVVTPVSPPGGIISGEA